MGWISGANAGQLKAILYLNSTSGAAGSAIVALDSVAHTGVTQDAVDITNFDSTESWREFVPGLKDAGSLTGEGNYNPEDSSHAYGSAVGGIPFSFDEAGGDANALVEWSIVWPTAAVDVVYGNGILTSWETSISVGDRARLRFEVKLTGKPTIP